CIMSPYRSLQAEIQILQLPDPPPLHFAAMNGNSDEIQRLLVDGVDVNARDNRGLTALHYAAGSGSAEAMSLLIDHGAVVDTPNNQGLTPLHFASGSGDQDIRIAPRWTLELTPVRGHFAPGKGNVTVVMLLIQHGAAVNGETPLEETPLHFAAASGNVAVTRALIESGAAVNSLDLRGLTPLHFATGASQEGVQTYLVRPSDLPWPGPTTSGYFPAGIDKTSVVRLLVDHGAELNGRRSIYGQTPLHFAVRSGSGEASAVLLQLGCDANPKDSSGLTPLHIAAANANMHAARLLIKHGADVNSADYNGRRPLHYAANSDSLDIVDLLLEHNADPTVQDKSGDTPADRADPYGEVDLRLSP
ncbi:MAG: ankyrin repeat domain-containing protein, partial [Planctomycetales bacterium]|nr:ankyrin repeat domain-containing protein [Planctomycetales bacterium]